MPKIVPPSEFVCPISHEIMLDPVITNDGKIYERKAIEKWLETHNTSPITNLVLQNKTLVAYPYVKSKIEDFRKEKNIITFQKFLSIVRSGDIQKLKNSYYFEDYLNMLEDETRVSALHIATMNNDSNMIQYIANDGAELKFKNKEGNKSLHIACQLGFLDSLKVLYKFDKDLEEPGYINNTALHYAAEKGHFEIAKFLLDSKANIEAKNSTGNTPLILASACKNSNVIELLLDCKANIQAINNADVTPLHAASIMDAIKMWSICLNVGLKLKQYLKVLEI